MNKNIFVRFPCVLLYDRRKKEFAVCSCHRHCPRFPNHAASNATATQRHCNVPWFVRSSWISFALTSNCSVGRSLQLSSTFSIRRHFRFNCTCLEYICIFYYYSLPFTNPRFREEKLVRRLRLLVLFFSEDVPSGCTTSKADFMPSPMSHSGISS